MKNCSSSCCATYSFFNSTNVLQTLTLAFIVNYLIVNKKN